MSTKKGEFQRLPLNISPYHYNITLLLDFENFTTTGEQYVYIDVKESTNNVILNSVNIDINYAAFQNENGDTLSSKEIIFNSEEEKVTIFFHENLSVGKNGYLHFKFQGKISDTLKGLYRSKHIGADENITYTAITQFAPTDARRCFPCWDEPIIKATFELTLEIPKAFSAISNMPLKTKTTRGEKTEIYKFDKSPKMSTYLLAFVVGDFDHIESKSSDNILTKIYTPKGKSQLGNYALDVAIKVLPFYKEYFKISYPLPKIDLISVMDFAFGGMENWGLIIAREMCLLVDMENTSTTRKQRIALLVSHEIAHQWFGNLVTMKWWDDLWLNEGYASFVEFLCVNHLFPEYDIWTQFVTNTYIPALELDALKNTHPIQVPINHPSEIDEIFDAISYNKAASIIRMLHAFIGDDNFKKGMNIYLERFSYKNAETEDLWEALEEASGLPVRQIMPTWTKQKGFPILDINHHWQDCDLILTLTQRRFFVDGTRDVENNLWVIPVQISLGKREKIMSSVMDEKKKEIVIKNISRSTWIKVNSGTIGYYRTKYSSELLELLISAIKSRELPPLDRLGILNDTLAFARAGETTTVDVLKLLQSFQFEINATVWSSIIACFDEIGLLVNNQEFESSFKSFGRSILRTIYTKLGWDSKTNENHLDTILRPCIIEKMIFLEDEEIINEAKKKFKLHLTGKCILPPDLKNPVYKAVLLVGDNETLETMLKLYRESDLQEEKSRILKAIGTVRDEHLIIKVLDFLISPEVRSADTVLAISSVTLTQNGRFLVWEFFKKNWKLFSERYNGSYLFPNLVKYVTEHFSTEDMAREVEEFFENKSKASIERAILQGVECIRLNSAWLNRDKEAMRIFLNSQ